MKPAVSVLQLDTHFPRVPGDVGCPATFRDEIEIIRIPKATVGQIVSATPDQIDIAPFEDALRSATGDVIVTSCGFLSYWQTHLAALTNKPFISSALTAIDHLSQTIAPQDLLTLTFDADSLTTLHFGQHAEFADQTVGLPSDAHLRKVISLDQQTLDTERVEAELVQLVVAAKRAHHSHLLLECTNLPPYKAALRRTTGLLITDILTCIENVRPGTIQPQHLGEGEF